MPLHTLNKAIRAGSSVALLSLFAITITSPVLAKAKEQAVTALPPMTVFATKNADKSVTQVSEVAWQDGIDSTIIREKDGSYTVSSTTNAYNLKTLLASLGAPTLNVDLSYAAGSVSMTADGNLTMSVLLEAFEYLNEGVTIDLMPTMSKGGRESEEVMLRRLEMLRITFERTSRVNFNVTPAKILRTRDREGARSDLWRIQIRRQG